MKNVNVTVDGDTLTITVDLTQDQGLSSSGKTNIVATTSGNMTVDGTGDNPVVIGLNVYRRVQKKGAMAHE